MRAQNNHLSYPQFLLLQEKNIISPWLNNTQGQRLLLIAQTKYLPLIENHRFTQTLWLHPEANNQPAILTCKGLPDILPIDNNSIDLILMTHTLDTSTTDPNPIFSEIHRVLSPEGQFILTGTLRRSLLNPFSLLTLEKMRQLLDTHHLQLEQGTLSAFTPASLYSCMGSVQCLEKLGPYIIPFLAKTYALLSRKHCRGLTPLPVKIAPKNTWNPIFLPNATEYGTENDK